MTDARTYPRKRTIRWPESRAAVVRLAADELGESGEQFIWRAIAERVYSTFGRREIDLDI